MWPWAASGSRTSALVVSSGVHGVEGFFGSAVQLAFLEKLPPDWRPPEGAAVVLIHALNPFGFAWQRRFNEENVDLNRNFLLAEQTYCRRPAAERRLPPGAQAGAVAVRVSKRADRQAGSCGTVCGRSGKRCRSGSTSIPTGSFSAAGPARNRRCCSINCCRRCSTIARRSCISIFTPGWAAGPTGNCCSPSKSRPTTPIGGGSTSAPRR